VQPIIYLINDMTGLLEKFEDTKTKGAIRSRKSKDRQCTGQQ
jgi:hypothetical protein